MFSATELFESTVEVSLIETLPVLVSWAIFLGLHQPCKAQLSVLDTICPKDFIMGLITCDYYCTRATANTELSASASAAQLGAIPGLAVLRIS